MRFNEKELLFFYLLIDLFLLNLAMFVSSYFSLTHFIGETSILIYSLHANLAWVISYFVFSKQNLYLRDGFRNRVIRIFQRTGVFLLVSIVLAYLINLYSSSQLFIFEYTLVFVVFKLIFYRVLYKLMRNLRQSGRNLDRALIVGSNETGKMLRNILDNTYMMGYKFVGYVSDDDVENPDFIGCTSELDKLIVKHNIQSVFVTLSLFSHFGQGKEYLRICSRRGVRLRFIPENQNWFKSSQSSETLGNLVILNPQQIPLDDLGNRFLKRLFDFVFSFLIITLIFSWMFPLLYLLIKLTSRGPAMFVQKRTGVNGHSFNCYKFRSMRKSADADTRQATANDDRITGLGKFMRKYNIDELPQFFNVLIGNMSVVGPRPHMLKHTEEYSKLIDYYLTRHYVKPGITGWAQVNGYRGETDELWKMEKRVEYDMYYIEHWTFLMDIKIIILTFFGKKAFNNAF